MSVLGKNDWLPEAVAKLLRAPARIEAEVESLLALATPLIRLAVRFPQHAAVIERYRTVREGMLALPSQVSKALYSDARQAVSAIASKADSRTRAAVNRELKAWDQLLQDLSTFEKVLVDLPLRPAAKLDAEDIKLFREFTSDLLRSDEPALREMQEAWRQFIRVVGPDNEAEWAVILKEARSAAEQVRAPLGEYGTGFRQSIDQYIGGHINTVQGKAWEAYARRCLVMLDEIDRSMRAAAFRSARLGPGWQPLHVNGELQLGSVAEEAAKEIRKTGRIGPQTPITWKQFADDGVLAVKMPPGSGVGEADAAALMEFKAEGGSSRLGDKLVDFHRRHSLSSTGETLLLRYPDSRGKEVVALLRPPDPSNPCTYYAVGTSNTQIPRTPELSRLGIDQRRLNGDISRDALRELMNELVGTAAALATAAP